MPVDLQIQRDFIALQVEINPKGIPAFDTQALDGNGFITYPFGYDERRARRHFPSVSSGGVREYGLSVHRNHAPFHVVRARGFALVDISADDWGLGWIFPNEPGQFIAVPRWEDQVRTN